MLGCGGWWGGVKKEVERKKEKGANWPDPQYFAVSKMFEFFINLLKKEGEPQ